MTLLNALRAAWYHDVIREREKLYSSALDRDTRLQMQLNWWNSEWKRLMTRVPYYKHLQKEKHIPDHFTSWQEFVEFIPVTTRGIVQQNEHEMASGERPPDFYRVTGGSTAEPIQLPAWNSEPRFNRPDLWLARSWYGLRPEARVFFLWGHTHLLGTGLKGWLNALKRPVLDSLMGYYRFSAYDLQPAALRRAAREVIRFRPDCVIGYSVALDLFARANADLVDELRSIGVKVVVGAAEGFPSPDSVTLLENVFGCPVAMEYGSIETLLIAHTRATGGYQAFWRTYFVEAERVNSTAVGSTVRVTSLYPRCFPLVRYEMGDEIELWEQEGASGLGIESFKRVIGRCNDYVLMSNGAVIHSEAFTHGVRACDYIRSYQVVQKGSAIQIHYTSDEMLSKEEIRKIQGRLARIHPDLARVEVLRVERLRQTIAGKTRMVLRS